MDLIVMTSNWSSKKPINSCLFVKNSQNCLTEDIESLLESSENCVQLWPPSDNEDYQNGCKLIVEVNSSNDENDVRIRSFSILCSSKFIEVHAKDNEYLTTLTNEFIDETDGMAMFRNDFEFNKVQQCFILTLKGSKKNSEMWVYAILLNVNNVPKQPNTAAADSSAANMMAMIGTVFNSMMNSSNKLNADNSFVSSLSKMLKTNSYSKDLSKEMPINSDNDNAIQNFAEKSDENVLNVNKTGNCSTELKTLVSQQCCDQCCEELKRHSEQISELRAHIDAKFEEFEANIDNKLSQLETKLINHLDTLFEKLSSN